ncbi:hypothetical protein GCM10020331_093500 [Ectobacillus funiculus]
MLGYNTCNTQVIKRGIKYMMTRRAEERDLASITAIYNQGIEDRIATLETDIKSESYTKKWLFDREERYAVVVAEEK